MEFPVIISFFTEKTPYEVEVQNLRASCEKFGLESSIVGVPSFGSWELNCAYKPFFILERLETLQRPVLWVDADGVFTQAPTWQSAFDADLSVRYDPSLPQDHPSRVITSTLFARPSAKPLLKLWVKQCRDLLLDPKRTEEFWDQIALRNAILEKPKEISVAPIPLSYAKIFDHPLDKIAVAQPVIEHYQASRRYKSLVNPS